MKSKITLLAAVFAASCIPTTAVADSGDHGDGWTSGRPDGHAPIAVMGDHVHEAGEWMLSYRYMRMHMDGNRDGTHRVSEAEVLANPSFMITPTEMDMEMHMFGVMRAFSDNFTLMAMIPYIKNSMDHLTMMCGRFSTESEGIGDLKVSGLIKLRSWKRQQIHLNAGLSLPTGSTDERDTTPMGNVILPYPMQLGSGTVDVRPGITYLGQSDDWSWGAQVLATARVGRNGDDYSLGDRGELSVWGARKWSDSFSTSLRLNGTAWGNIDGRDSRIGAPVPTADPRLRCGERVDALIGLNYYFRNGKLKGHRIALEYGLPIHQDLDGPQLEVDNTFTVGWQYAF
jgi:hypothetical protein